MAAMEVAEVKKVITYGTFDLFHYGHLNLLKRAKALGDYLVVGVTIENFDINRGKLNVQQPLMERVRQVKETGLADEIIPEEYDGQKIDDIQKYDIDIFAIGSDWEGVFDYLEDYCEVVYISRTEGVSSTYIREQGQMLAFGIIGKGIMARKMANEAAYVSGIQVCDMCSVPEDMEAVCSVMEKSDAVYILAEPSRRGMLVRKALSYGCHVVCESPVSLGEEETKSLYNYAHNKNLVLFDAVKTAYLRAFSRLVLLVKGGAVGNVKSIDATCTSMHPSNSWFYNKESKGGSMADWGAFVLLPVFKIFGLDYRECKFICSMDETKQIDMFTEVNMLYPHGTATLKTGYGVKSEGSLVISGTKAYIYVPSPWWRTEYFEIRYENFNDNRRYFYKVDGEGIRYELAEFLRLVRTKEKNFTISSEISQKISKVMEEFLKDKNKTFI